MNSSRDGERGNKVGSLFIGTASSNFRNAGTNADKNG